ncbi:DUF4158 domain-containing protein [Nonomuraea polychroma]|uniref:DUF4158 domain-containing protein n=1 Tax=Nonomuraea polychroma TaxID=46176 RepID=UPI003D8E1B67
MSSSSVRRLRSNMRRAVLAKDNPADLINLALEELVRARCELPGYTTLDAMAVTIRTEVNNSLYQSVARRLDAGAKVRLARMLVVDPISRRSEFDRLKDVAQAASLGTYKQPRAAGGYRRDRADRGVRRPGRSSGGRELVHYSVVPCSGTR